eukprot:6462316-Amphidinium_carterae.1
MTRFICRLRLPLTIDLALVPVCTLLELYVCFVLEGEGALFCNFVPNAQNGHHISLQMESFRHALLSLQEVVGLTPLIAAQHTREFVTWPLHYGLPKQEVLIRKVLLPGWHRVRARIAEASVDIARTCTGDEGKGVEVWRRWCVGVPGTQTDINSGFSFSSLVSSEPKRISRRSPMWRQVAFKAHWWFLEVCSRAGLTSEQSSYIRRLGVTRPEEIRALAIMFASVRRRAAHFIEYNNSASDIQHIVASATHPRLLCARCQLAGPLTYKIAWLRNRCHGGIEGFSLSDVQDSLASESDFACAQ